LAEAAELMDLTRATHADIDLLQADEIGFGLADDACQSLEIVDAVVALAVVDVVAEHAQLGRGSGAQGRSRDGEGGGLQEATAGGGLHGGKQRPVDAASSARRRA